MTKFLREPPKVRTAASVIVVATLVIVVGGGALFRVLDHKEYASLWIGMWFALQTVTTVGYGDVTPKDAAGKLVAALIMLEGIAFLAIVTAAITSTFIARAAQESIETAENGEVARSSLDRRTLRRSRHAAEQARVGGRPTRSESSRSFERMRRRQRASNAATAARTVGKKRCDPIRSVRPVSSKISRCRPFRRAMQRVMPRSSSSSCS